MVSSYSIDSLVRNVKDETRKEFEQEIAALKAEVETLKKRDVLAELYVALVAENAKLRVVVEAARPWAESMDESEELFRAFERLDGK